MKLALAIIQLLAELGPTIASIWKDLSPEDQEKLRLAYRNTMNHFDSVIAQNDEYADAIGSDKGLP